MSDTVSGGPAAPAADQPVTVNVLSPTGNSKKATIEIVDAGGKTIHIDRADLRETAGREKAANKIANALGITDETRVAGMITNIHTQWFARLDEQKQQKQGAEAARESGPPEGCPWTDAKLPPGYYIAKDGGLYQKGEECDTQLAAKPVWVEAQARDAQADGWGKLVHWLDQDGNTHRELFTVDQIASADFAASHRIGTGGAAVRSLSGLSRYLNVFDPPGRLRSVNRPGWVDASDTPVYMTPAAAVGNTGEEGFVYLPDHYSTLAKKTTPAGSLVDWQCGAAALAEGNPVLLFTLCASFAAPLLHHSGQEGGGFHLHGASSKGKTTAMQLAASVWGCGADPAEAPGKAYIQKWNATGNALEALAADHSDGLLVLDEIGESQVFEIAVLG
jgi:hypothetical protein